MGKGERPTFLSANGYNGAHQLQAFIPISVHSTSRALHPRARLEVDGVQCDDLGRCKKGVEVQFSHGAGYTIRASRCTDQPSVPCQSVINILTCTNRACFVIVWIFGVASLWETNNYVRTTVGPQCGNYSSRVLFAIMFALLLCPHFYMLFMRLPHFYSQPW